MLVNKLPQILIVRVSSFSSSEALLNKRTLKIFLKIEVIKRQFCDSATDQAGEFLFE